MNSGAALLVTLAAGSACTDPPPHPSPHPVSSRALLPFIAEITKYIIKLRVHKRRSSTSEKPSTAVSAAAGQHSSASQPPSMTTPESMWLWHQRSCLTAPHPPAFDWHSVQPVGALKAQAGKLALFPLIAVLCASLLDTAQPSYLQKFIFLRSENRKWVSTFHFFWPKKNLVKSKRINFFYENAKRCE